MTSEAAKSREEVWAARPNVLARELDGELVLMDLDAGIYFGLNEVGLTIWEQLERGAPFDAMLTKVVAEFEVDESVARADIEALLAAMAKKGLVEKRSSAP